MLSSLFPFITFFGVHRKGHSDTFHTKIKFKFYVKYSSIFSIYIRNLIYHTFFLTPSLYLYLISWTDNRYFTLYSKAFNPSINKSITGGTMSGASHYRTWNTITANSCPQVSQCNRS